MGFIYELAIAAASVLTIIFLLLDLPINLYWRVTAIVFGLTLLFYQFFYSKLKQKNRSRWNGFILFVITLTIFLIIFSTGNIYSPFLIIAHLYSLGLTAIYRKRVGTFFIFTILLIITASAWIDPRMIILFQNDPATTILYIVSFLTIIPITNWLANYYTLKETIISLLKDELTKSSAEKQAISNTLDTIVVETDSNLNIISANHAFENLISLSEDQSTAKQFFDVITLTDQFGKKLSPERLQTILSNPSTDKTSLEDYYLQLDKMNVPIKVTLSAVSTKNAESNTYSIAIKREHDNKNANEVLSEALRKSQRALDNLISETEGMTLTEQKRALELIQKREEDIWLYSSLANNKDLETSTIHLSTLITSISQSLEQKYDRNMVLLKSRLEEDQQIHNHIALTSTLLEKILELSISLNNISPITASVISQKDLIFVLIETNEQPSQTTNTLSFDQAHDQLFAEYKKTNITTGLEGQLITQLSESLQIPISVTMPNAAFTLQFVAN